MGTIIFKYELYQKQIEKSDMSKVKNFKIHIKHTKTFKGIRKVIVNISFRDCVWFVSKIINNVNRNFLLSF